MGGAFGRGRERSRPPCSRHGADESPRLPVGIPNPIVPPGPVRIPRTEYYCTKCIYGSFSPGRGKWAKCVIFLKLHFDQTVWFFKVFSTVLKRLCPLESKNTFVLVLANFFYLKKICFMPNLFEHGVQWWRKLWENRDSPNVARSSRVSDPHVHHKVFQQLPWTKLVYLRFQGW